MIRVIFYYKDVWVAEKDLSVIPRVGDNIDMRSFNVDSSTTFIGAGIVKEVIWSLNTRRQTSHFDSVTVRFEENYF